MGTYRRAVRNQDSAYEVCARLFTSRNKAGEAARALGQFQSASPALFLEVNKRAHTS